MTEQEFIEIKKGYVDFITKFMIKNGELGPSITVIGTHKEDGNNAIVHVPIPGKFMKSDESKDEFIDEILPEIAKKIAEDFTANAIAWASEAWLRVLDKKDPKIEDLKDWKSLPVQKEVLIINIEHETGSNTFVQEIVRKGKQVNEDGELVDHIQLIEMSDYKQGITGEGRFTGLYKKFKESSADL